MVHESDPRLPSMIDVLFKYANDINLLALEFSIILKTLGHEYSK
jgi:hypothetical protein